MGLLSGLVNFNETRENLNSILEKMMYSQRHRDFASPRTKIGAFYALGMANSHDYITNYNQSAIQFDKNSENNDSGIYALSDGIVLDVSKHINYFNSIGMPVKMHSGSVTIAASYKKWGIDFINHLEGEFSCVVWDENEQKLLLVRDPYGHKPLHYYHANNQLIFSSEIKGILAAGISSEIDLISLSDFISLNNIPYPSTIFKNIYQVPPGGIIIFSRDGIKKHQYWYPKMTEDHALNFVDVVSQVTDDLRKAVKKRMVTDDVYCFLSGGIDSSAIVSFASELSDKPIHTISVGFEEGERNELADAEIMAKHVNAVHHKVIARPDSFFDMLDTIVFHQDAPFTDTSAYPTYYAAKLARNLTDIILTGDGPDQTMGGSGHHVHALKNNIFKNKNYLHKIYSRAGAVLIGNVNKSPIPNKMAKIERKFYRDSVSPVHAAYDLRSGFPDIVKKFICCNELWDVHVKNNPYRHPESWFQEVSGLDNINKYLFADIKFYVPDDLMVKVDRMCMAHNLETLSPFQDIELAQIINSLPGNYKIHNSKENGIITKYILKKVCQERFPKHTLSKKKQGFGIPIQKWLKQKEGQLLREILLDDKTLSRDFFKKEAVETMVNTFIQDKGDYYFPSSYALVALLTFELWHRRYID
ncbi:hypothetical protein JW960_08120 [candidate division KSB1 bacterium]|nr:hypothetical protein [candidate division KSB1 bacterium]